MTTFKHQSYLLVTGSTPGFTITLNASAAVGQQAFTVQDFINAPVWTVPAVGGGGGLSMACYGDHLSVFHDMVTPGTYVGFDGIVSPACLELPNGTSAQGPRIWSGSGVPSGSTIGGAAALGDIYLRTDTPSTANQRVYHCTTAGTPGTWTARL
jgi:hypothetical protein